MGVRRRQHNAQFKAQVAMAALVYGVHPTKISTWKRGLVKHAGDLFERGNKKSADPQKLMFQREGVQV